MNDEKNKKNEIFYKNNHDIDYIHSVTNISKPLVNQYIKIIKKYVKEH